MDRKKIEQFLKDYYASSCDSSYKNSEALGHIAELFEELIDFCENVEEFCKDTGKRLTRIENIIATPRWLSGAEVKQNEEIEKLKDEVEAKRQHINNLCEVIASITVKARGIKDESDELYYGILNGNLRDKKGQMKY